MDALSGAIFDVTGANRGIGLITAERLAKQGAHVVLACRRTEEAEARIEEARSRLPNAQLSTSAHLATM